MKFLKNFFFAVITISLFVLVCSCNKMNNSEPAEDPQNVEEVIPSLVSSIIIVDAEFNDRLNPKSPSYYGDEYVEGIKIFLFDKEKDAFPQTPRYVWPEVVWPPIRWIEDVGYISNCADGFYCIPVGSYIYIQYPDGSKDEIKVQYWGDFEQRSRMYIEKIWFNNELVFEGNPRKESGNYYNPKYFPRMIPLFDDEGNPNGERPFHEDASNFIFAVTK